MDVGVGGLRGQREGHLEGKGWRRAKVYREQQLRGISARKSGLFLVPEGEEENKNQPG